MAQVEPGYIKPGGTSAATWPGPDVAGPMVQTIFARRPIAALLRRSLPGSVMNVNLGCAEQHQIHIRRHSG
jgi:hypothetical protein